MTQLTMTPVQVRTARPREAKTPASHFAGDHWSRA